MSDERERAGFAWQVDVWDRIAETYQREIDRRFAPVIDGVISRAGLRPGERVLDLGAGTGAVGEQAARAVGERGAVVAVDPSTEMLAQAERRMATAGLTNVALREGRAETIPAEDGAFDAVLASLSLMFVLDRAAAAREIVRVLRPGGRLVAAVWGGPEECELIRFQQLAGRFAPPPPVRGAGPGSLGDPTPFVAQLAGAGITAGVESEMVEFGFANVEEAWAIFAGVTAAGLSPEQQRAALASVRQEMDLPATGPIRFRNLAKFIIGNRTGSAM